MSTTLQQPDDLNFFDADTQDCPYDAYKVLREEAPVWRDPVTGFYYITRYDDLRQVLLDTEHFSNERPKVARDTERAERMKKLYEEKGWLPSPTLAGRDDPNHKQMRAMFDNAFRAGKIKGMDPLVEETAYKLIDGFLDDGHCDWVKQFAVPLPLIIIGKQMGAKEEDIWRIKAWTDAWVQRLGMMQTEDEERWSVEMEIEAQHYFQPIFERLRKQPDGSLLSDLVNTVIPEWGRPLNNNELHAEMMADTFVGGSETSTNALSAGMMLAIQNPDVWDRLKQGNDKDLRTFAEEVLRLESPVQSLFRIAAKDIELHGVTIPAGSMINTRYASANRDEGHFECPEKLDLDRKNAGSHLAFGSGIHHCLGAPLARRELYWGFKAMVDRFDEIRFAEGRNDFRHAPNFCLRALKELHIEFTPAKR
ncbi:MAG: cytochrome P450 [Alphaproteobacteria bacterium]|nr:cytochrome P450 [Alphaproteobacteria bacterium]